jgi:[ribosomal protein S5]-alanine N-acetyltransferase
MKSTRIDTFETQRLAAERLRPDHLCDYLRLFQDSRAMKTLSPDGEPLSNEEAARWLQLSVEHWERHAYGFWALRTKLDQQFVGRAGLKNVDVDGKREVELAYAFLPQFWGQGLATEVSESILKVAFETLRLSEVICFTLKTNLASQRVMQKVGFRFEREGEHVGLPHVFYRLSGADFAAHAAGKAETSHGSA